MNDKFPVVILSPQVTYYRVSNTLGISVQFLEDLFQSSIFQTQLKGLAGSQSTRAYVGITKQKTIRIPLPPLSEQREIAEILQTVDEKIEIEQKKKELYEELFKSMLNQLMTGRIRVNDLDFSNG